MFQCWNDSQNHQEFAPIWENRSSEHRSESQERWIMFLAQPVNSLEIGEESLDLSGCFPIFKIRIEMLNKIG